MIPQTQLNELPSEVQDWYAKGEMMDVLGRQMFVIEQVTTIKIQTSIIVNMCLLPGFGS